MKVVLLAIALVLASVLLLGVRVLFVKGGTFPSGHAHTPALRKKGIGCAHGTITHACGTNQSESH